MAAILASIVATIMGSLLWRLAFFGAAAILSVWLIRRLFRRRGADDSPIARDAAMILPILVIGIFLGLSRGIEQRTQSANELASAKAIAANSEARSAEIMAQFRAAIDAAQAQAARTAAFERKFRAAEQARRTLSDQLRRRSANVSRLSDGSTPRVPAGWVRDYNAALGPIDGGRLPAVTGAANHAGGAPAPTDPTGGGVRHDGAAGADPRAGKRPDRPAADAARLHGAILPQAGPGRVEPGGLMPTDIADVLANHIDNAERCGANADQLSAIQAWYAALKAGRDAQLQPRGK